MARVSAQMLKKRKRKRTRRAQEAGRLRGPKIKLEEIDYKNVGALQRLISAQGKLFSRKRTGLDAQAQRTVALAIKRARFMAMLSYVS